MLLACSKSRSRQIGLFFLLNHYHFSLAFSSEAIVLYPKLALPLRTAMVVARIERKPERLCAGDEFQEVGYVVQKGLRARRGHLKD